MQALSSLIEAERKTNPEPQPIPCRGGCGKRLPFNFEGGAWVFGGDYCDECEVSREREWNRAQFERKLEASLIPSRFQRYRLDQATEPGKGEKREAFEARVLGLDRILGITSYNRHVVDALRAWTRAPRRTSSIWLKGPVGNGKTLLACAVGQELLEAGLDVLFYTEGELFSLISAERNKAEAPGGVLHNARNCDVLILDEANADCHRADPPKPWMVRCMAGLVNARYNADRPILFTSNNDLTVYAECWRYSVEDPDNGQRIASRLIGMCARQEFELMGWDWRTSLPHTKGKVL